MDKSIALTLVLSLPLNLSLVGYGEDLNHLQQLLSTRQCPQCDLSGSGLVQSNLVGAKLNGANLVGANLSQANLSGADLSGANLTSASLFG
ncbi:MAG: pentapeptide repeat-containing protein, partial [Microcystis panniformis]